MEKTQESFMNRSSTMYRIPVSGITSHSAAAENVADRKRAIKRGFVMLCALFILLGMLALPGMALADDSNNSNNDYSSDSSSKNDSESSSKDSNESKDKSDDSSKSGDDSSGSSSDSSSSSIQSNCTAIDSTGTLVPGVWVPQNDVSVSAASSGQIPGVQGVMNYREIRGM